MIKPLLTLKLISLPLYFLFAQSPAIRIDNEHYTLLSDIGDKEELPVFEKFFQQGVKDTEHFFSRPYKRIFTIRIHPTRTHLDAQWQQDWNIPAFKSECWMVASGVASHLDIISPRAWKTEACEHNYSDTVETQQLITHELVHVFHGQSNPSGDFSDTDGVEWFIEGLATYASGQCSRKRIQDIKALIKDASAPVSLDNFWKGKHRYGLAGTMVMHIDQKYGRKMLSQLLTLTTREALLKTIGVSENELIDGWQKFLSEM